LIFYNSRIILIVHVAIKWCTFKTVWTLLFCMADIHCHANGWLTLRRTFTFNGTSPTNHFCTDR